MGLGFTAKEEDLEEESTAQHRTVIECTLCTDKDLYLLEEGSCSCGNIEIGILEALSATRHNPGATWTHFKTVRYKSKEPLIYEVLIGEELP